MKPTSPPPPETLSDDALLRIARGLKFDSQALDWPENLIIYGRRVYAAGYEARGKRDAEIARTEVPGDMCGDLIAAAIERTPEQPTTQREDSCPTCFGTSREHPGCLCRVMEPHKVCSDPWHSQPTTQEDDNV